jgi:hypothetical protein
MSIKQVIVHHVRDTAIHVFHNRAFLIKIYQNVIPKGIPFF